MAAKLGVRTAIPIRWIKKGAIKPDYKWKANQFDKYFKYYFKEENFNNILKECGVNV